MLHIANHPAETLLSQKERTGTLPRDGIVLNTIVTSDLESITVEKSNIQIVDTLTRFKIITESTLGILVVTFG